MRDAWIDIAFQSTHPVRGGTKQEPGQQAQTSNFNPPTPCGVGHKPSNGGEDPDDFNPPTPCGVGHKIASATQRRNNFNPPTPCGVGHQKFTKQDCKLLHMQQNTPDSGTFLRKISDYTSHPSPFYCQISVRTGKGISVRFPFARSAKSSGRPLAHRLLWPQNARFWSDKHSPDSKTEGCPFSHP